MTIVEILLKASVLIGLAALAQALRARRMSAATRHLVWTLAIAGLLLLPILAAALPGWTALELNAPPERLVSAIAAWADKPISSAWPLDVASGTTAVASPASALPALSPGTPERRSSWSPGTPERRSSPAGRRIRWSSAATGVYLAGVLLLLGRAAAGRISMQRLAR